MTTRDVYEKYSDLAHLLSDPAWMPDGVSGRILLDCWLAIAAEHGRIEEEECR